MKKEEELKVRISPEDKERIRSKMEEAGILNMSAYVRKMALDGICVRLDLVDVRQLIVLLQRCSTNLNQYAKNGRTRLGASMRRTSRTCAPGWTRYGSFPDSPLPALPISDSGWGLKKFCKRARSGSASFT